MLVCLCVENAYISTNNKSSSLLNLLGTVGGLCVVVHAHNSLTSIVLLRCLLQFGSDDSVLIIDAASAEYNHLLLRCLVQFGCDGSHLSLNNRCSFCRI